jgi:Ni,Fe-hydrogenase III large subunit
MDQRLEESVISATLVLEVLDQLPRTPASTMDRLAPIALPPNAVGLGWAEGSRGAEIVWVETDGADSIVRFRLRSASFAGWQAFARCVPGTNILTDFPIIEQSFGLSVAGADR